MLLPLFAIAYCLLPIAYYVLPIAYCLLPIADRLSPIAYRLSPIGHVARRSDNARCFELDSGFGDGCLMPPGGEPRSKESPTSYREMLLKALVKRMKHKGATGIGNRQQELGKIYIYM